MRVLGWRGVWPSLVTAAVVGCGGQGGDGFQPEVHPPELRALVDEPPEPGAALPAGPAVDGSTDAPATSQPLGAEGADTEELPTAPLPSGSATAGGWPRSGGSGATSESTPTPTPSVTGSPAPAPTPSATGSPTPTPTPSATSSPAPTPTPSATGSPTPTPTPSPAASEVADEARYTVLPEVPLAEPASVRGLVLLNGRPPGAPVQLSLVRTPGWEERPLSTDAAGAFQATGLAPGDYLVHFYNETQRDRVGYWRSRTRPVSAGRGATFPAVDLGHRGMVNQPAMDARVGWPVTFSWEPPAHRPVFSRLRVHSEGGRTFSLLYQSGRLPVAPRSFTWDGAGASPPLVPGRRYFWGLVWDLGPAGESGNLYQAVQLVSP